MKDIAAVFAFFKGNWEFLRQSRALHGSDTSRAQGRAFFLSQGENILHYKEEGMLQLAQSDHSFYRHYFYLLNDNRIDVLYGDGPQKDSLYQSYCYDASVKQLQPAASHLCGDDTYRAIYGIIDDNRFTLTTTVLGPRKDYVLYTEFRRLP